MKGRIFLFTHATLLLGLGVRRVVPLKVTLLKETTTTYFTPVRLVPTVGKSVPPQGTDVGQSSTTDVTLIRLGCLMTLCMLLKLLFVQEPSVTHGTLVRLVLNRTGHDIWHDVALVHLGIHDVLIVLHVAVHVLIVGGLRVERPAADVTPHLWIPVGPSPPLHHPQVLLVGLHVGDHVDVLGDGCWLYLGRGLRGAQHAQGVWVVAVVWDEARVDPYRCLVTGRGWRRGG